MARTPNPRLRAAMARQAERIAEAVRAGGVLDDDVRRRLADLLEVCGRRELRETLHVHVRDKVTALSDAIAKAQEPRTPSRLLGRGGLEDIMVDGVRGCAEGNLPDSAAQDDPRRR